MYVNTRTPPGYSKTADDSIIIGMRVRVLCRVCVCVCVGARLSSKSFTGLRNRVALCELPALYRAVQKGVPFAVVVIIRWRAPFTPF